MKLLISNIKNEKAILKNSEYENILSKSELERVRKFSSQKRKNEFILGRILLRAYLSKKLRKEEKDIMEVTVQRLSTNVTHISSCSSQKIWTMRM